MPRIYVEFAGLDRVGTQCKTVSSKVNSIQSDLQRTIRQLDWDVRFESNIDKTATQLARKLDQYSDALKKYQQFIEDARSNYVKLDEYGKPTTLETLVNGATEDQKRFEFNFGWKDVLKAFGNAGSVFGIINGAFNANSWIDWGKVGVSATKTIASIAKSYNKYSKIGRAVGTSNASSAFWKNFFGLNKVGKASQASSASSRFYNNLHNTTSPYKLSGIFDSFTGKKGAVSAAASWAGVALSGIASFLSNKEEQANSNGTMSNARVIAETITETAIDTIVATAGSAVVGAAIATVTGVVAAPAVVAIATGAAVAGINAGVKALTGKSATEWVSDAVLDTACAVGSAVKNGAKAVAKWFGKLSFA